MKKRYFSGIALLIFLFTGCEKEIELNLPPSGSKIVVEGHVEPGMPTYVILTRNTNFFDPQGIENFADLFVNDAIITVSDGTTTAVLEEFCLQDLPAAIRPVVYEFLGLDPASAANFNLCAYISFDMMGEVGKTYTLNIHAGDHTLNAITTIPAPTIIDSLWTIPHLQYGDSLVVLWAQFKDPDTLGNFYRYFTKVNSEPFFPGYFGSVTDDILFNGQSFKLAIDRGYSRNADINFRTYGLFRKGDTISLKLASIDRAHFRFWQTVEDQLVSGGPFATPTYIISNIKGGLGVWGGYGPVIKTIIVEE